MTNRDMATGRYTDTRLNKMCVCGHPLGEHSADKRGDSQPCYHGQNSHFEDGPCECPKFRWNKKFATS